MACTARSDSCMAELSSAHSCAVRTVDRTSPVYRLVSTLIGTQTNKFTRAAVASRSTDNSVRGNDRTLHKRINTKLLITPKQHHEFSSSSRMLINELPLFTNQTKQLRRRSVPLKRPSISLMYCVNNNRDFFFFFLKLNELNPRRRVFAAANTLLSYVA